jgi:ribosomal protein L32E
MEKMMVKSEMEMIVMKKVMERCISIKSKVNKKKKVRLKPRIKNLGIRDSNEMSALKCHQK